jgi:hypothetical protein
MSNAYTDNPVVHPAIYAACHKLLTLLFINATVSMKKNDAPSTMDERR